MAAGQLLALVVRDDVAVSIGSGLVAAVVALTVALIRTRERVAVLEKTLQFAERLARLEARVGSEGE